MTREERIEQYTFIYVDKEPEEALPKAKKTAASKSEAKKTRRPKPTVNTQPEQTNVVTTSPSISNTEVRRQSQRRQSSVEEEEPPPVKIAWKTAAARKSLPASITMHKGSLDLQKCNMSPVVKIEQVFALQNAAGDGKLIDQFVYSTKVRLICASTFLSGNNTNLQYLLRGLNVTFQGALALCRLLSLEITWKLSSLIFFATAHICTNLLKLH